MEADIGIVRDAALGSVALSLLLLVATAIVRVATNARSAKDAALTELWTPYFFGIARELPGPIETGEERAVLALWNRVRAAMRGPAAAPLVARAREAGLHTIALELLESRRADDRLNAVSAVGTLGLPSALPALERFARKGGGITLRSEAARSMLRLDGVRSLPVVLDLLRTQGDWHPALMGSVLEEANPNTAAMGLVEAAVDAAKADDVDLASRLLRSLVAVPSRLCLPGVRELLADTPHPSVQASCLLVLGHFADPRDRAQVRRFLFSSEWYVRVHAVSALGAVGNDEDETVLIDLLTHDPEWWVRQRAAEALGRAAGMSATDLAVIFDSHPEAARFAGSPYSPVAEVTT